MWRFSFRRDSGYHHAAGVSSYNAGSIETGPTAYKVRAGFQARQPVYVYSTNRTDVF